MVRKSRYGVRMTREKKLLELIKRKKVLDYHYDPKEECWVVYGNEDWYDIPDVVDPILSEIARFARRQGVFKVKREYAMDTADILYICPKKKS